ncbi:MAG TPA: ubiquinol-cytochrome c reductase iron-sulfur subunit [Gemmatimonadales bacterium]|nr:ubiquinol-cytochrome c reductase iron-sulfur subunit [Gemmatimonadales bacterium]
MTDEERRSEQPVSDSANRREFLRNASSVAMGAGLIGGYGAFGLIAGRYLYPVRVGEVMWQFVAEVAGIKVGQAIRYRGPAGEAINITRQSRDGGADDFIALSSTCPHLGCQVRWEAQNNRFFCPCHSGVFDPSGKATGGPPGEAGQSLPRYALKVERGLLHIAVPPPRFSAAHETGGVLRSDDSISAPGHDPCLAGHFPKKATGDNA